MSPIGVFVVVVLPIALILSILWMKWISTQAETPEEAAQSAARAAAKAVARAAELQAAAQAAARREQPAPSAPPQRPEQQSRTAARLPPGTDVEQPKVVTPVAIEVASDDHRASAPVAVVVQT